jgi:hypothetical protein
LSKIITTFEIQKNSLYAVQFEGDDEDIFAKTFNLWNDIEYLEEFFENNQKHLNQSIFGYPNVEIAVSKTLEEAHQFESTILKAAKTKRQLGNIVFHKLSKYDNSTQHTKSKAYGSKSKSWLRIYALCLSDNIFIVTGGAIKLTLKMQGNPILEKELRRL